MSVYNTHSELFIFNRMQLTVFRLQMQITGISLTSFVFHYSTKQQFFRIFSVFFFSVRFSVDFSLVFRFFCLNWFHLFQNSKSTTSFSSRADFYFFPIKIQWVNCSPNSFPFHKEQVIWLQLSTVSLFRNQFLVCAKRQKWYTVHAH